MDILDLLTKAIRACARIVSFGAGIQSRSRKALVEALQNICSDAIDAYSAVLKRLQPVKDSFTSPKALADEIEAFRADEVTRSAFKPDHLCGRVDQLLMDLANNLDPSKYSLDISRLNTIRSELGAIGTLDRKWYDSYDNLTSQLDAIATQLKYNVKPKEKGLAKDLAERAIAIIKVFEDELRTGIADIHDAKERILFGKTYKDGV
jgi:hypothetical protein